MKWRVSKCGLPLRGAAVFATALLLSTPVWSRSGAARRHNRVLRITNACETWIETWLITDTIRKFPGGGRAGFYRRVVRAGLAVPPNGREGILYLYPESRFRPARLVRNCVAITPQNSRLVIGAAANRNPSGEWQLRLIINRRQFGQDLQVTGRSGWQDFAFDLAEFTGRQVDIELEAYATGKRAPYVYLDYIRLENPADRPATMLMKPAAAAVGTFHAQSAAELPGFDESY